MKNIKAYRTFYRYLDNIWNSEEHNWLGALLSQMSWLPDGSTADPAHEYDWDDAVEQVTDPDDAYMIGMQFLRIYLDIGYIDEIGEILKDMEARKRLDLWEKAVHDVEQGLDDPYLHLG